jgi:hypothetical protein
MFSKEEKTMLLALGKEMNAQSNRGTQWPMFVIQVDVKRYVSEYDDSEHRERKEEFEISDLCKKCKVLCEAEKEMPEDCDDCHDGSFHHYNIVQEFSLDAGVFLTAKACEEHIAANKHRYTNPRSFGISAGRNPEMQKIMNMLSSVAGNGEAKGCYR